MDYSKREQIEIMLEESETETIFLDGLDEAILGITERDGDKLICVYSRQKCIDILTQEHEMSAEEAQEFFDFNIQNAYFGDSTPIIVDEILAI